MQIKFIFIVVTLLFASLSGEDVGGRLIEIGDGRKMYLECQGTGSPTVVLISGRSDRAPIWQTVYPAVAKFTHVCAYDRPGTVTITGSIIEPSRSSTVPQPTTPKDAVTDLHALLIAAKIPPPYLLVGHSYGGLVARLYASSYPNEVVGLVLIDTLTEFLYNTLNPSQQALWIRLNSNYSPDLDRYTIQERTNFTASFEQLRTAPVPRPMPVVVLTSDQPYDFQSLIANGVLPPDAPIDFGNIVFQAHLQGQKELTQLLKAKQITNTHAGHYIQTEQPQLVVDAIRDVIKKQ